MFEVELIEDPKIHRTVYNVQLVDSKVWFLVYDIVGDWTWVDSALYRPVSFQ